MNRIQLSRVANIKPIAGAVRLALIGMLAIAPTIHAQTTSAPSALLAARSYDIPPGPLSTTISRFASAAGVAISFDASNMGNTTSPGLKGSYTVEQGFADLLQGTGWHAASTGGGNYVLQRSAATAPSESVLPAISVSAVPSGNIIGYVASRSSTGTKTDTPMIETPQAMSVITREQMDDQGAAPALQDALRYTPGLIGTRGVNLTDDSFNMRGFAAGLATSSNTPVFRDGLRQMPAMYASTVEPYGVERIDVLRGPGSVLFGQVTPGGIVNVTSKRPTTETLRELDVQLGNHAHKQIGLDLGGALGDTGEWSYRLTTMVRDADTQTNYIPNDRQYIAPALTWRPSAATSLTLLASYQHTRTAYNWGFPVAGSLRANPNGQLSPSVFTGEPGFDKYDTKTTSVGYQFEHAFNDTWTLRQNARYYKSDMIWNSAYGSGLQTNQRLLNRFAFIRADEYKSFNIDTHVQAKWKQGIVEHTFLAGVDYADVPWVRNERRGSVAALDLYNPVYGAVITPEAQPRRVINTDSQQTGLYLQEQAKIADRWILLAGLRHDLSRSDVQGYQTNGSAMSPRAPVNIQNNVSATTGRLGIVYLTPSGWAPYASYSTSFEPEAGALDFNGNPFKPTRGRQVEVGIKYEPTHRALSMTAAVFDLKRTDVLTADPLHTNYSVQVGEIQSRGLEVDVKGRVGKSIDVIGAYTYTDAEVTRSNNPDQGTAPPGVPKHNIALWGIYRIGNEGKNGWKIGAGVRRIIGTSGYVLGTTPTPATLPSYSLMDAMVSYQTGPWTMSLNMNNVFDKTYIQSCYYGVTTCFYGEERSAIARLTYRW